MSLYKIEIPSELHEDLKRLLEKMRTDMYISLHEAKFILEVYYRYIDTKHGYDVQTWARRNKSCKNCVNAAKDALNEYFTKLEADAG